MSKKKELYKRIVRNAVFWLIFALYHYRGRGSFVNYPVILVTLVISYGIPCYINNLLLIPRYLLRHKYLQYSALFILLLFITTTASYYSTMLLNVTLHRLLPDIDYMGSLKDVAFIYHAFPSLIMFALLTFGKFTFDAITNQRKMEHLEKQKLESELENLKSQINPHFLFNALNTIYGMARRTDKDTADAIMKLSDILRHSLYECNDEQITIEKEMEFLQHYIEFARLRVHDKNSIKIKINADLRNQKIAPLLLIPFVENAIKHGLGKHAGKGWVDINISVSGNELLFVCANSNYNKRQSIIGMSNYGGIGFKNAKRRLELLYPSRHALNINDDEELYKVELKMQLT